MTRLLTVEEVAERLGVTKDWVWAQARAGRIPHVQLGRYRRFGRRRSTGGSRTSSSAPARASGRRVSRGASVGASRLAAAWIAFTLVSWSEEGPVPADPATVGYAWRLDELDQVGASVRRRRDRGLRG